MDTYQFLKEPLVVQKRSDCNENTQQALENALGLIMVGEDCTASSSQVPKPNFEECETDLDFITNPYMANALDVIDFKILLDVEEFKDIAQAFKPTMAHQIFGHEEVIYGYRNLQINFNILPNSFHTNISIKYTKKKNDPLRGEVADNIIDKLAEWFPHNIVDENAFTDLQTRENMGVMFGETILSFKIIEEQKCQNIYINICNPQEGGFLDFHKRFQGIIVFYIDAASIIEFSDKNWTYFYVYQDINLEGGKKGYIPIGFCTVYTFTMSQRARIAQQFILPNFQSKGIGRRLLGCVYSYFSTREDIQYITVESPCEGFTIMRDKLDLFLIANHPTFCESNIFEGFSQKMESDAKAICKMCVTQIKHLYFVLLCHYSKNDETKYNVFVRELKREVHSRYKKKLKRMNTNPQQADRVVKIKQIVQDDYMENRRIHKDSRLFLRAIRPQLLYLNKYLPKPEH